MFVNILAYLRATSRFIFGNGNATFSFRGNVSVLSNPNRLAAGDFNNDGKTDLAVANYGANQVSILPGNGDGTFQAADNYIIGRVNSLEETISFFQEIYDQNGNLVEIHEKFPEDKGHRKVPKGGH